LDSNEATFCFFREREGDEIAWHGILSRLAFFWWLIERSPAWITIFSATWLPDILFEADFGHAACEEIALGFT